MPRQLNILALDISTNTGWAAWKGGTMTSGVQEFRNGRGDSPGMRFLRIRKWVEEMVRLVRPDLIAYERPNNLRSTPANECIFGLTAAMHEEASTQKVETLTVGTAELKKHATGKGNAKKPAMVAAANKRWKKSLTDEQHDEADALLVLAWALQEYGAVAVSKQDKARVVVKLK